MNNVNNTSDYINSYININDDILKQLIYKPGYIKTVFSNKTIITYADYIASGLASPIIEKWIEKRIYPYYSNTHSNAHNGQMMKNLINQTKSYIREQFNIDMNYQILFPGSGTTAAINHLTNSINWTLYEKVKIYLTLYEHYSNHLPWVEIHNIHSHVDINYIPFEQNTSNSGIIDLNWLKNSIQTDYIKSNENIGKTLIICSITACSNINGIINPLTDIKQILNMFGSNDKFHSYLFADFACSAPYVQIDGNLFDAFFFSPHKFIGGIETPGVLIGKSCLFEKTKPFCSGGGCVKKATSKKIIYETDIERRESAGTPNIIGIIKLKKILELKAKMYSTIKINEHILCKLIKEKIIEFESKYSTFRSILYADNYEHLPILSFNLSNLHYNLIVVLFNDLFGIQTRGGIGCCGLLAEYMENIYEIKGWCRISFHWLMNIHTVLNIFKALEFIIQNSHKYVKLYKYDSSLNLFTFIESK